MTKKSVDVELSDVLRALHTFTSLAGGTGNAQYPPFSYGPFDDEGRPIYPNQFPITKDNCLPALVVWLFLVTNPVYLDVLDGAIAIDPENPQMVSISQIAQATNLTEAGVQAILNVYINSSKKPSDDNNLRLSFRRVNSAFQDLADLAGYVGGTCPDAGQAMLRLAEDGASVDPNPQA
jgi:hypothetical protein